MLFDVYKLAEVGKETREEAEGLLRGKGDDGETRRLLTIFCCQTTHGRTGIATKFDDR